jgi:hypothetical protein
MTTMTTTANFNINLKLTRTADGAVVRAASAITILDTELARVGPAAHDGIDAVQTLV